ncbi:uncharacterized protein Dpit47 [Prorops nasuta]|uniref:uncharacterized protein Dpit47 n=1 Tax=Prorops nasuta TaxID=863751 RepID=UPI0034CD32AD
MTNLAPMTEKERLELASKLDKELDDYINSLEKKRYTEGWPEDRWESEMDKHPFFMNKAPEPGEELSPLMEGLQQLKYSEDENTPEELANNYKEDGNFNYKYKKYRLAILSYTEGIRAKCKDQDLMAQLYNNRAAAQFMLKNYRSSLCDCKLALKHKSGYTKALCRAATCCFQIKDYDRCIDFCDQFLDANPTDKAILKLKSDATVARDKHRRDKRMKEKLEKKISQETDKLLEAIRSRNINLETNKSCINLADLEPQVPQIAQSRVYLDDQQRLTWPVMILYPETRQTDFIQNFHEDTLIHDQLKELFEEPPEWDSNNAYTIGNINVYFEGKNKCSVHKVNVNQTLGKLLQDDRLIVRGGTPALLIVVKCSIAEKQFLSNCLLHNLHLQDTNGCPHFCLSIHTVSNTNGHCLTSIIFIILLNRFIAKVADGTGCYINMFLETQNIFHVLPHLITTLEHPLFMIKVPEPGEELSPLMEGLQQLKYAQDENTPEELASNYKEDGNFNYKYKRYRLAILSYTEGIRAKCKNQDLMAQLYNNRAAGQFMLKNYRSSLCDCKSALKNKSDYTKALYRAATCCSQIKDYDQCIDFGDQFLDANPTDKTIIKLKSDAIAARNKHCRDKRMKEILEKKINQEIEKLLEAIRSRNINVETNASSINLTDPKPQVPQIAQSRVYLDYQHRLIWPVMILYPETRQTDFIQNFHEDTLIHDQLKELFEEPPEWDSNNAYTIGNINVYFEGKSKCSVHNVNANETLGKLLQDDRFIVQGGTPALLIVVKCSIAEKQFLSNY